MLRLSAKYLLLVFFLAEFHVFAFANPKIQSLQNKIIASSTENAPQLNNASKLFPSEDLISESESLQKAREGMEAAISREEDDSRRSTRQSLLKEVSASWEIANEVTEPGKFQQSKEFYDNDLLSKINKMVIPKVSLVDMPLTRVVEFLANIAEKNDPNSAGAGINFVLLKGEMRDESLVNLNLKNISLYKLVDLIAKSSGYQFDVTNDAVIFYKRNTADDVVETHFFPVPRATVVRLTGKQKLVRSLGHKDIVRVEGNIAEEERSIKEFFQRAGVTFDVHGSNLAFDGSQIIVTNTSRNLKKISDILKKYSEVKQVEIETKFLEVQQGVLDELGFRWRFNNKNNTNKTFLQTGQTINDVKYDNLRSLAEAFVARGVARGDGKIVFSPSSGAENTGPVTIQNKPPMFPGQVNFGESSIPLVNFTGVLNSLQCSMMIQALEQHSGSDLMSAPKLTVLSGKTAEIVVATEFRYPQKYGDMHSEVGVGSSSLGISSSAGVTITSGTPQDFATRNVGVEMMVTPTVEIDGSISLQLEPKVTEFEGFVEYGGSSVAVSSGTTVTLPSGFYQPIFSTREICTEVNVFDGATVVMGGLTREEVKEVNDKVPILGDIPLIGLLFRSKSETTQKRNLLIFVTARTISPSGGISVKTSTNR